MIYRLVQSAQPLDSKNLSPALMVTTDCPELLLLAMMLAMPSPAYRCVERASRLVTSMPSRQPSFEGVTLVTSTETMASMSSAEGSIRVTWRPFVSFATNPMHPTTRPDRSARSMSGLYR